MSQWNVGNRAPPIIGAAVSGRFYSLDAQAGRPAALLAFGALSSSDARLLRDELKLARSLMQTAGVDVVPLAPAAASFAEAFASDPDAQDAIIYVSEGGGLDSARMDDHPAAIFLDRSGRITHVCAIADAHDLVDAYRNALPL